MANPRSSGWLIVGLLLGAAGAGAVYLDRPIIVSQSISVPDEPMNASPTESYVGFRNEVIESTHIVRVRSWWSVVGVLSVAAGASLATARLLARR
jgi:hypothetical protein